jgi:hypothetical protein
MREHLGVIEAIERRDEQGAVAALTRHINNARSRAMRIAPEHDPEKWDPVFGKGHAPLTNGTKGEDEA